MRGLRASRRTRCGWARDRDRSRLRPAACIPGIGAWWRCRCLVLTLECCVLGFGCWMLGCSDARTAAQLELSDPRSSILDPRSMLDSPDPDPRSHSVGLGRAPQQHKSIRAQEQLLFGLRVARWRWVTRFWTWDLRRGAPSCPSPFYRSLIRSFAQLLVNVRPVTKRKRLRSSLKYVQYRAREQTQLQAPRAAPDGPTRVPDLRLAPPASTST